MHYVPPPYPGRLTIFRRPVEDLDAGQESDFGWKGMASGGLEVIEVPASHLDMPVHPIVARELRRLMNDHQTVPDTNAVNAKDMVSI
jgi:thioesterase domain-containing protein